MSNKEPLKFVDFRWLADMQPDPHADLVDKKPEELSLADYTHDELANEVFMIGDRSKEEDMRLMLEAHRTGKKHIPVIAILTATKERMRWMARRIAVLEGRYPGKEDDSVPTLFATRTEAVQLMAEAALEWHLPKVRQLFNIPEGTDPLAIPRLVQDSKVLSANPSQVASVLGYLIPKDYVKRWHLYVELARNLLKKDQIYLPFIDDIWDDNFEKDKTVYITQSKYYGSGTSYPLKVHTKQIITTVQGPSTKELIEARAMAIYSAWKGTEGWVPWVIRGNSDMQNKARKEAGYELQKEGTINEPW